MIGYERSLSDKGPLLRAMDVPALVTILFFSVISILFPDTGIFRVSGHVLPRGYVVGAAYLGSLLPIGLLMNAERRYGGRVLCFFRTFYPQIFITFFFMESIQLSSQVFGGWSHDGLMVTLDERIFGFQPYMVFYKAFESIPRFNELMFGSYFSYYLMVATLPWIPWLRGDRKETERAVFIYFFITLLVSVWYVFFRVQGPKYWIPELKNNWYGNFQGYLFVHFFQRGFDKVTLSGAAFPSSHVLFTSLCVIFGFRWDKRLLAFYLPMLALIIMATIYIYAHYAVDGIAALFLAPLLYFASSWIYVPFRALFPSGESGSHGRKTEA